MSLAPYVGAATVLSLTALLLVVQYVGDFAYVAQFASVSKVEGDAIVRRLSEAPLTSHPSVAQSDRYQVKFDGISARVVMHRDITDLSRGANNMAQIQLIASGNGGYEPVTVEVTSMTYSSNDGSNWNIRPSRYWDELTIVRDVNTSRISAGVLSFTVWEPCQLSVELGDPDTIFATKSKFKQFANLILAFNPPESSWPQAKPTLIQSGDTVSCESAELGRACIVAAASSSCDKIEVPADTDMYFSSQISHTYVWGDGDGCSTDTKVIELKRDARMFLDSDVVVFARARSGAKRAGVYGYGIMSNSYMNGTKDKAKDNIVRLMGADSEVFGVTLLDATYRNIKVGERGIVHWTKSFAWQSETDCVATNAQGTRVHNNFFKLNDDCLKPYYPNTTFQDNIIWHQGVGRAIMVTWGNHGQNKWHYDGSHKVLDTYIIHDQKAWSVPTPDPLLPMPVAYHASTVGYGALIGIQKSTSNQIGMDHSHLLIENTYVEERIGIPIVITNGFGQLNGMWLWQAVNTGCPGAVHMKIKNLDMRRVTGIAAQSIAGGCDVDYKADNIENGGCLCTSALNCSDELACGVKLYIEDHINPTRGDVSALEDSLIVGMQTQVHFMNSNATSNATEPTSSTSGSWATTTVASTTPTTTATTATHSSTISTKAIGTTTKTVPPATSVTTTVHVTTSTDSRGPLSGSPSGAAFWALQACMLLHLLCQ